MKVSVNKKILRIVIGIIITIVIVILGVFASKGISTNIKIKETETTLSQINVKELENKLIEELKQTNLNVNTSNYKTIFGTLEELENVGEKEENIYTFLITSHQLFSNNGETSNLQPDFISAYIIDTNSNTSARVVSIPLFKIESDNNGKFKNIIYTERALKESIVPSIIEKVLKDEYGIDMLIVGNEKYNKMFNKLFNSDIATIYYYPKDFFVNVLEEIKGNTITNANIYEEYSTTIFGLEF